MRFVLLLLLAPALYAQASDAPARLLNWLAAKADAHLDRRAAAIAAITTVEQAEARKREVRAKILELIGGLPDYNGPLNARVTGKHERSGVTVENVLFDSLPRYPITANLYRPSAAGKYPAVLFPLGHWREGKLAAQRIAINLAAKGFVVLAFDPVGQGERLQAYDARLGDSLAGGSTTQHFLNGAQSILMGKSFARYRIWDAKRALDYLVSRPDVDSDRIGCTGCSGGGTVTTYISALDPRIKVAAPACYMNSFRVLFKGAIGDSEQSVPGFLSSGLDQTDYVELFAPKPWLIASTLGDYFTPEGARQVLEEAQRWYRIYGEPDKIRWVVGPGGHGTPKPVREAIYDWFIRWLKDGKGNPAEENFSLFPDHELTVTKTGQVATSENSRDLQEFIAEEFAAIPKAPGGLPPIKITVPQVRIAGEESGELLRQKLLWDADGVEIEAVVLTRRDGGNGTGIISVETAKAVSSSAEELAKAGNTVLAVWPRGLPSDQDRSLVGDWQPNTRAWLVGESLPLLRAQDIAVAAGVLAARPGVKSVKGTASGVAGYWLLMAAANQPKLEKLWLRGTPPSIGEAMRRPLHRGLHDITVPGLLLRADVPQMLETLKGRQVIWTDPVDWMGNRAQPGPNLRFRAFDEPSSIPSDF